MGGALDRCCKRELDNNGQCTHEDNICTISNNNEFKHTFTALAIEGGGAKGIALGGTLRALEEFKILRCIKRIAGSSAGAICASLLSVGFNAAEITELLIQTDMNKFMDDKFGVFRDTLNLLKNYGQCPGDYFLNWIEALLAKKTGIANITFKNVFMQYDVDLRITSVCVNTGKLEMFSSKNTPDLQVSKAVRMSMSIPFVFEPVEHDGKLYVDGGVGCNYPLHVFDDDFVPSQTLGLKLMGDSERADKYITNTQHRNIDSITDFTEFLVEYLLARIERLEVDVNYWERTLIVPTGTLDTLDFDMDLETKQAAIAMSYKIACQQLEGYDPVSGFIREEEE